MHLNGAGARKQPHLLRERREAKQLHCYEHARSYCHHLDWKRIPLPGSGLELSYGPWLRRKCSFLNAFPCPMARFRAPGRKRDSGVVLVLEHRGKRADVPLFYFPAGPRRHTGLPSKLAYLYSQFDADSETQVRFHRCCTLATSTRDGLTPLAVEHPAQWLCRVGLQLFGRWLGGLCFLFFRLTHYGCDRLKFFAVAKVHQFYAHRVAAGFANFFDARAHHLAFVRDQHDLVCFANCERTNHFAGFFAGLHGDDSFAAARLPPVIIKRRAFADSIFASDEQHGVWIDNGVGHDMVAFLRANSPNADSVAALIAQLFFMEAQAHSVCCDEDDLVVAVR